MQCDCDDTIDDPQKPSRICAKHFRWAERITRLEREACAKFVETTYLQDETHEEALRARFIVPESSTGYLEAWHRPRDVAEAIRNRDNL